MSNHEIQITEASVDLDYNEILENIEDTIAERISAQITDEAWDAVEYSVSDAISDSRCDHESEYDHNDIGNGNDGVTSGVQELLLEYKNTPKPCEIGIAFEQAVWKAICRLDNPDVEDEWASAAREYLLDRVNNDAAPTGSIPIGVQEKFVRTVVQDELSTILLSFAKAVDARLGAEVAVAPGD
jgi:hypothetical protein